MFGKLLCKLGKHKQKGPFPIGEPKDIRYICKRCKRVWLIREHTVYIYDDPNDPLVILWNLWGKYIS
jgi:hypothetical protein